MNGFFTEQLQKNRLLTILVLSLVVMLLVLQVAWIAIPGLEIGTRHASTATSSQGPGLLAANPELMIARQYTGPAASGQAIFLAANPELMVARGYAGPTASGQASLLAANPELMTARGYAGPAASGQASFLAANPELMVARGYTSGGADQAGDSLFSENPELRLLQLYRDGSLGH